jgi:hypothetical protein
VTPNNFGVMNVMGAPLDGTVSQVPGTNAFRWTPQPGTPPGALSPFCALALRAPSPELAIQSRQGIALDGEFTLATAIATGLPSGDGVPGGDFTIGIQLDV